MKITLRYYLFFFLTIVLCLSVVFPASASDISGAHYYGIITASNNSTSTTGASTNISGINTTDFISQGWINSSATNCAIRSSSGSDIPFMPGYGSGPWVLFIESIGAYAQLNYTLYSDDVTGGKIRYFPGSTGMYVNDHASIEPSSNNISITFWDTYFDTTQTGHPIFTKGNAITCNISNSGNITAEIWGSTASLYLLPNAAGTTTNLPVANPAVAHYLNVDDPIATPDDAATYVGTGVAGLNTDTYNLESSTFLGLSQNITAVTVYFRHYSPAASELGTAPVLYLNGNTTTGTEIPDTNVWTTHNEVLARPGGGTWSPTDIPNLEAGIQMRSAAGAAHYCTQVYVKVDYAYTISVSASGIASGEKTTFNVSAIQGANWLAGWDNRIEMTVDSDYIDSDLTHFPLMIKLDAANAWSQEIYDEIGANNLKLAITEADGTTELYIEVDTWDSSGNSTLWASLSTWVIDDVLDTTLYFYYDNDHADNAARVGVTDSAVAENVWDANYVLVAHMSDNSTSSIYDSTSNDNDGAKLGANEPIEATGKIGKAQNYDNSDDAITAVHNAGLTITGNLTLEAMVYRNANVDYDTVVMKDSEANSPYEIIFLDTHTELFYYHAKAAGGYQQVFSSTNWANLTWHYLALTRDTNINIYRNGNTDIAPVPVDGVPIGTGSGLLYIGARSDGHVMNGLIDELRISNIARSAAWIKANYYSEWGSLVTFESYDAIAYTEYLYNLSISINSVVQDRAAGCSITDTASNYIFGDDDVTPYIGRITIAVDGITTCDLDLEYAATFTDASGYGNTGYPSYRTTSSDADVSAELISWAPISEPEAPAFAVGAGPDWFSSNITISGNYTTGNVTLNYPLKELIESLSTATATPSQLPTTYIFGFVILAASLGTTALLRQYGSASLFTKLFVLFAGFGFAVALGIFDWWMVFFLAYFALFVLFGSSERGRS